MVDQGVFLLSPRCPKLPKPDSTFIISDTLTVNVTLTALNGKHEPSVRILNLNPDRRIIQIGRASKNPGKGLSGASDNAWFDSPVMSRNHAEISLKSGNNVSSPIKLGMEFCQPQIGDHHRRYRLHAWNICQQQPTQDKRSTGTGVW